LTARKHSRDGHRSLTVERQVAARLGATSVSDGLRKGTKPAGQSTSEATKVTIGPKESQRVEVKVIPASK